MLKISLVFSLVLGVLVPVTSWAEESTGGAEKPAVEVGETQDVGPPTEPKVEEPAATPEVPKVDEPPAKVEETPAKVEEPLPEVKSHIESDDEAKALLAQIGEAAKGGEWVLFVGLGISLLLYGARRFNLLSRVPTKFVPLLAALLGVLWYLVPSLLKGGEGLQEAFTSGLLAGLAAVGSWETVMKRFFKKAKPAESAES